MGSCVSLHKDPESALKLRLDFGSKTDKLVNPSSHQQNNLVTTDAAVFKSHWSPATPVTATRNFGSKEETFFDSHPWLESDCEDDFFSVHGDFTPSRGNTPVHNGFSVRSPKGNNGQLFADRSSKIALIPVPEPSPTAKKKLSELFKDPVGIDRDGDADAADNRKGAVFESGNATPAASHANSGSGGSSQRTPQNDEDVKPPLEKSVKSVQCCLPRLQSLKERKKSNIHI